MELRIMIDAWNHGYHGLEAVADGLRQLGARVEWYSTVFDREYGYHYEIGAYMSPELAKKAGIPAEVVNALTAADWAVYAWPPDRRHGWCVADRGADRLDYLDDVPAVGVGEDTTSRLFGARGEAPTITAIRKM